MIEKRVWVGMPFGGWIDLVEPAEGDSDAEAQRKRDEEQADKRQGTIASEVLWDNPGEIREDDREIDVYVAANISEASVADAG